MSVVAPRLVVDHIPVAIVRIARKTRTSRRFYGMNAYAASSASPVLTNTRPATESIAYRGRLSVNGIQPASVPLSLSKRTTRKPGPPAIVVGISSPQLTRTLGVALSTHRREHDDEEEQSHVFLSAFQVIDSDGTASTQEYTAQTPTSGPFPSWMSRPARKQTWFRQRSRTWVIVWLERRSRKS
jgi:hypothetical protein